MRSTSSGMRTMASPFKLNITTMVSSSATNVIGLMAGMNTCSYQASPFSRRSTSRERKPAANGMPK